MQPIIKLLYNDSFYSLNENNILIQSENWSSASEADREITYSYTYNDDYFPTKVIGKDQNGRILKQIEYQYNR